MTDSLTVFGTDYTGVTGIKATGTGNGTLTYIRPQGTKSINSNGTGIDVTEYASVDVSVSGGSATPSLQSKSATPTTSQQVITPDSGYDGLSSVTVSAMPTGTAGTPTATKGSVSNHSVSVTPSVTNTTGYITGGTKTGTVVSVSASELVSGTYTVNSSGTKDVTNYASASVPALTLPTSASSSSSGTYKASVQSTVTDPDNIVNSIKYLNIPTGFNGTAQHYAIDPVVVDTLSITENGTYDPMDYDLDAFSSVTVNVSGGGSTMRVGTATQTLSYSAGSINFTNLSGQPTSFIVTSLDNVPVGSASIVASVAFDGSGLLGDTITNTNNAQVSYTTGAFNMQYADGTLSISSSGADFQAGDYKLAYTYGGTSGDVHTEDVQVGSGATSITFTGLEDEPSYWSCVFKSNFGTSNGYQRVITVVNDGTDIYGLEMDSSAKYSDAHWTSSYSNGSLTITSSGTNAGGYFHQPGYYQLTYAIAGDGGNYQSKTVTPTTSQQVVQADSGYDALKMVTVNAIPNTYIQPTTTVGATTYRASTSAQTIQSGTYHSAAATIAAVSQTNLSAENIKSGTTISISNGQSNLWSVTGTYTGSGGSSKNVQVAQSTTRVASTTYTKTASLTCSTTGTYDVYWDCFRSSTSGTSGSQLYIGGSAYGTANTTFSSNIHAQTNHLTGVSISANQEVAVYVRSRGTNYYAYCGQLTIVQTA